MKEMIIQLSIFPGRYFEGFFKRFEHPLFLLLFTFLRLKRPLKLGKEIYPLSYELIRDLVRHNYYKQELSRKSEGPAFYHHYWQLIMPANSSDELLLDSSLKYFLPQEVCQIVLHLKNGDKRYSGIHRGGFFSFGSFNRVNRAIARLLHHGGIEMGEVRKIEIIHTHPSLDFILETDGQQSYLYVNGLSQSDLELAKLISQNVKVLVTVKAVTHARLSYSTTFCQGKVVDY